MSPANAHEFAAETIASQRKFGAGNVLINVSLIALIISLNSNTWSSIFVAQGLM
jgi:hypothetical protein